MKFVKVTQEHIKSGKRKDPESCAVALALKEALGTDITVSHFAFYSKDDDGVVRLGLFPSYVWTFIERFDKGKRVNPMTFSIL